MSTMTTAERLMERMRYAPRMTVREYIDLCHELGQELEVECQSIREGDERYESEAPGHDYRSEGP